MFAEIVYKRAGDLILKTPFVPGFIAELKAIVPGKYRLWEPAEKTKFTNWLTTISPSVETIDLARAALVVRTPEPPQWAKVLYVQPDAPREVVEAAYRALSKKYHPDRGGNEALMKQLNDAIVQAREAGW